VIGSGTPEGRPPGAKTVLVAANRTAATPALIDKVGPRARESECTFTLLVSQVPGRFDGLGWSVFECSRQWGARRHASSAACAAATRAIGRRNGEQLT
jgi:hypothetical protein